MSAPAHWLRPNEQTRLPSRFIYLDTEARQATVDTVTVQRFLLAAVAFDHTARVTGNDQPTERDTFTETAPLWEWITEHTNTHARTILVAHNLAYDLRISEAFAHLARLGWTMARIHLDGRSAWGTWRLGRRTLTMIDTLGWFPHKLDTVAMLLGMERPKLPRVNSSLTVWAERCQADVEVLREAWGRVMAWLRTEDLGNFKPTGAGQSWAAFRHRFYTHPILVHADPGARQAERTSVWTGRCEAWRHGRLKGGRWVEWDYTNAYAALAATAEVPVKYLGNTKDMTLARWGRASLTRALLTRATVTTQLPTLPAMIDGRICWPTGTFETTVWEPELAMAMDQGARVRLHEVWVYRKAPALVAWANWVLEHLGREPADLDPVLRLVLKHWARALIGKFGSRWSSWSQWGTAPWSDVTLGMGSDADTGERFRTLQLGTDIYHQGPAEEASDATPQVMAYIVGLARVRLWEAMRAAGLPHVAYVDTDSLIVDRAGHVALQRAALPGLRVKGSWPTLDVLGPRQIKVGGQLRAAGIPRGAVATSETTYRADTWTGLAQSLSKGEADRVTVVERNYTLRGTDHRRRHLADGTTAPFRLPAEAVFSAPQTAG